MHRPRPSLRSQRLRLRPFVADDAPMLQRLAGAREIADTTVSIPHPYSPAAARTWIAGLPQLWERGTEAHFAVDLLEGGELVGAVGLSRIDREHAQAELGFWVGLPWWGRGIATEAAQEAVRYGWSGLGLNRIYAQVMLRNPASRAVLQKLGMKQEGVLRQRVRKWDRFEDVVLYALLREDAA